MAAHLDIDSDLPSNNPSSKLHALSRAPSSIDRLYSDLPITPPSPPHAIPPEYRQLREQLLLNWVNHKLGCDPRVTRLSELLDREILIDLIETVAGSRIQPLNNSEPRNLDTATKLLHDWIGQQNIEAVASMKAVARGDQDQFISLLSYILTQYQAYIINAMQDDTFGFISSHVHPIISIPHHGAVSPADIQQVLLTYAQVTLAEYVNAALIPSIDDCSDAWQDGLLFMALLHCHEPDCVRDMQDFVINSKDRSRWRLTLETAFRRAHNAFHVPILLDASTLADAMHVDEESILAYLVEFVYAVRARNKNEQVTEKRQSDIERWQLDAETCSTPSLSSAEYSDPGQQEQKQYSQPQITLKTTYTQVRLTKTTKINSLDEEFQARVASLLEKIAQFQNRLVVMIPTRSSNYQMRSSSVATPDTQYSFDESEGGDHSRKLHPLQAGQEDLRAYELNFAAYQATLQSFKQDELEAFHQFCNLEIDTDDSDVKARIAQVNSAFQGLLDDTDKAERLLETFRHEFGFAQLCASARTELDAAQTMMLKMTPASTDTDIPHMEAKVEKATCIINDVAQVYSDLVQSSEDEAYPKHFDALVRKNKLVKSWVEEVRIWFAEAERIRKWIEIRTVKLDEIAVPEAIQSKELPLTRQEIETLNAAHEALQKEIRAFDSEDMARLRAHVKPLMGGQLTKELSPADARTIEITLTAINLLEQLMGTMQRKSNRLQELTNRLVWEEELVKTKTWIDETEKEVEAFVRENARWQVEEDDLVVDGTDETRHRDQLMAQERLKELVIQRLLMLENKGAEFEHGQYAATIEAFDDLEDSISVNMPDHLNARHDDCCQRRMCNSLRQIYVRPR
ncbi:hypothetical protein BX666DRAFT_1519279 [Dichotomocladium elegans]|nr:hypothetical protein BX666DRAFT_1519279 [Dichotomocladium elegans]